MKGNQLMEPGTLAQRITENFNNVSLSHLINITQYSKHHFETRHTVYKINCYFFLKKITSLTNLQIQQ